MDKVCKVGNAQGFWGDQPDAPKRLLQQQPDLDYLTLDYLAELSLSIMAIQRQRDTTLGYAQDFVEVIRSLAPSWKGDTHCKIITNAGGLNPLACARQCQIALKQEGITDKILAVVSGDDLLELTRTSPQNPLFSNSEKPTAQFPDGGFNTANAYLGAEPIVKALCADADIVITGRVADPSLTVAACRHHHNWPADSYKEIAGATVAGHLIECGTQVTGGISTDWMQLKEIHDVGFPIVEVASTGDCVVTKPEKTGGAVSERSVKEQLLYEIDDPGRYLSPDATVSFLHLQVTDRGNDRVEVAGAEGTPPPPNYKVSATYREGYRSEALLTLFGRDAVAKGKRAAAGLLERLRSAGFPPAHTHVECLGACESVPGILPAPPMILEIVLRIAVSDPNKKTIERFTKEIASLVTCGPQGITGYATGRPKVRSVFGYWPCLVDKNSIKPHVQLLTRDGS